LIKRKRNNFEKIADKEIDRILDEKQDPFTKEKSYLVKWKRLGFKEITWLPENVFESQRHITKFNAKKPKIINYVRTQDEAKHPLVSKLADHIMDSMEMLRNKDCLLRPQLTMDTMPNTVYQPLIAQHAHHIFEYRKKIRNLDDASCNVEENRYFGQELQQAIINELALYKTSSVDAAKNEESIEKEKERFEVYINSQQHKVLHDIQGLANIEY